MRIVPGLEEPLVATGGTSPEEDLRLDAAIAAFRHPPTPPRDFKDDSTPFARYLREHPNSPWTSAIQLNLGLGYYRAGYFSLAFQAWERAWQAGRSANSPAAKALADRALGELARMHARVGHAEALEALFADMGERQVSGPATEMIAGAREGLWMFRHDPGLSYLCGPRALKNVLLALHADAGRLKTVDEARSGPQGFSLEQVAKLAETAGFPSRMVFRSLGQAVPVPSVVHWKLRHYAAIVGESGGIYHLQDPTFASGDLWVTREAIDAESSGYFLVPTGNPSTQSLRTASAAESRQIHGMGFTGVSQLGATTPADVSLHEDCGGRGLCAANAKLMLVSLNLSDTPVGYAPQKGPPALIRLTYNQREAYQPANFGFFNIGPKWTLNVLSYIQDDPNAAGRSVLRSVAGGGAVDYSSTYTYNGATGAFSPERQGQAVLVRIPATGPVSSYELRLPDGGKQVFSQADGGATAPRRMFLSRIVDPAGNALSLQYDEQLRLTALSDATGRETRFDYGLANKPLLVTRITDPFGRHADLTYDGSGRLSAITDVLGLSSSFAYDAGGLINAMTTPYGTSRFSYGQDSSNRRFLEMTDPLGFTERLEFAHAAPGIPGSEAKVPAGMGGGNIYLEYRNTFHWDKHVYPISHTDYNRAVLTHWLHNASNQTSPIVESTRLPLESRIWYLFPGQPYPWFDGSSAHPSAIGRVMDDGSTQARRFTYNALGKPLSLVDPLGRRTLLSYDPSGIDLLKIEQQTSAGGMSSIAAFAYNGQHRPLSFTDAAGEITRYEYNAAGQVLRTIDPLGNATGFNYDDLGRLSAVINPRGKTQLRLGYDDFDRVATRTDSEGHTLAFAYDPLDRLTRVTYPDGSSRQFGYDKLDLASTTDRLGRTTTYAHDANRRLTAITDALSQTTRFGYFENGALKSLTDPNGNTTTWDIDIQGRPIAKHYADGSRETTTYEKSTSRLKSRTDALNQQKLFSYFNDDELKAIAYNGAVNPTAGVNFSYDPYFPRPTRMVDGIGNTDFVYRDLGTPGALQLAIEDGPLADQDAITYGYDALGRISTRTVGGAQENFAYDSLGRLLRHDNGLGSFTYDYLGETQQVVSEKVLGSPIVTTRTYDTNLQDRRLIAIGHSTGRGFDYVRNLEDMLTRSTEQTAGGHSSTQIWDYGYDAIDRLLSAQLSALPPPNRCEDEDRGDERHHRHGHSHRGWGRTAHRSERHGECERDDRDHGEHHRKKHREAGPGKLAEHTAPTVLAQYGYDYDPADNLIAIRSPRGTQNASFNSLNQTTDLNGQSISQDANGNVLDDGLRTYRWDAENRLIGMTYKDNPAQGTSFVYDGLGRRVARTETDGIHSAETRYVWCGGMPCLAMDGTSISTRRYFPQGEQDIAKGAKGVYARDHLGSIRDLLDAETGKSIATLDYDPYGNPTRTTGISPPDFRYAGMFHHAKSDLYLTQYRAYDPRTGRWLSRDPLGEIAGVNLYNYAQGAPVNYSDSSGLIIDTLADVVFAVYDIYKLLTEGPCERQGNLSALGFDLIGAITPGATGLGAASRAAKNTYSGVRDASNLLKASGVPRAYRKQVIESFQIETIHVRTAGQHDFGIRYFDEFNAPANGRYLFDTFPASRDSLALLPEWNAMSKLQQWQIRPGASFIEGRAAAQGSYNGGQIQRYILDAGDLLP